MRGPLPTAAQLIARGTHGEHRYPAEEYGLTREAIRAEFGGYIARFGL